MQQLIEAAETSRSAAVALEQVVLGEPGDTAQALIALALELHAITLTLEAATDTVEAREEFQMWAQVDLMGHQTIHGHVREVHLGGRTFFEITEPEGPAGKKTSSGEWTAPARTVIYSTSAVYSLTPSSEEAVRQRIDADREWSYAPGDSNKDIPF